jgi:hypothetical protein
VIVLEILFQLFGILALESLAYHIIGQVDSQALAIVEKCAEGRFRISLSLPHHIAFIEPCWEYTSPFQMQVSGQIPISER